MFMGLRDDKLLESPKLLDNTKDSIMHPHSSTCGQPCAVRGLQELRLFLQRWCPSVEDSVLHGRFRVSETRTSECGSCSTEQQHHHCLPRAGRTHTALCTCACGSRGRPTGQGGLHIVSQAAPS